MNYLSKLHITTRFLVLFLIIAGLFLAYNKPLWNDETYSQVRSVAEPSVPHVISGWVKEGNNCPLFYLLQKGVENIFSYRTPRLWYEGTALWSINWPADKLILRIIPVMCMAFAVGAIFYYFARFYSLAAGGLALFLSLTTSAVWIYWVEARHYPLWFFLTTLQCLLFLHLCRTGGPGDRLWNALIIVHLLLSLTVILSAGQILVVSILLYLFVERNLKRYVLLTVFPVVICLVYYALAPKYDFWMMFSFDQCVRSGISRDRLYILYLFVVFFVFYFVQNKTRMRPYLHDDVLNKGIPFLCLTAGMIISAGLIYFAFQRMAGPPEKGFPVTTRYFVYLAPVGIIGTTLFSVLVLRSSRQWRWLQVILIMGMGYFFIHRAIKVWADAREHFSGLFV